ncbi:DsbA family protein [Sphingomonas canadensis]|uniref:DsbA family protein n=1 Tax=Sphingomonas canadensis TaxID=1219257 RepID=A0ABW3H2D9_9SPHN|nr:DsbA family protein [Sphingomonas canadensis]MCW3834561.1 DsbA family protein [Sphingomonas canadensis]
MRVALALIPLMILAGCGGGSSDGNVTAPPVANIAPPAGKQWVDVVTPTPEGGMIQGNPEAPIKLVEYGSRSCPACRAFALTGMAPLREKYVSTGRVSYEFREFFVHPQDLGIALVGRCVSNEAFFPVLDAMYEQQDVLSAKAEEVYRSLDPAAAPLTLAAQWAHGLGYVNLIKQMGVSEDKANACLSDQKSLETISKHIEAATAKGVSGTPTFFINDRQQEGAGSWPAIEQRLQAAGAR